MQIRMGSGLPPVSVSNPFFPFRQQCRFQSDSSSLKPSKSFLSAQLLRILPIWREKQLLKWRAGFLFNVFFTEQTTRNLSTVRVF